MEVILEGRLGFKRGEGGCSLQVVTTKYHLNFVSCDKRNYQLAQKHAKNVMHNRRPLANPLANTFDCCSA